MQNRDRLLSVAEPWRSRRARALTLVEHTLRDLDPYAATLESLREVFPHGSSTTDPEFVVLALGKAAQAMARAALEHLAPTSGYVLSPFGAAADLAPLIQLQGSHPDPSPDAPDHARQILAHLGSLSDRQHLVCLISGGGSALLELPQDAISLGDLSRTSQLLMHAGADIQALNRVRRALSQVKGGGLLRACGTAHVTNLILSDVVGGPLYAVASGPTLPVHEPAESPLELLTNFGVRDAVPAPVLAALGSSPPAPAATTPATWLVADNDRGVRLLAQHATALGLSLQVLPGQLKGPAATAGEQLFVRISAGQFPSGFSWGGETTVKLDAEASGSGGRNQELILAAARAALSTGEFPGTLVSFGSDGVDGQSPAAGALLDQALLAGLDLPSVERALARHDSHPLLHAANATLLTGPTGTNVADLLFWLPD